MGEAEIAEALAQRDPLTGLTNRTGWDLLVAEAQERVDAHGDPVAVAIIHLDQLTSAAMGPNTGDEITRRAANALKAVSGSSDRLARYGDTKLGVMSNDVPVADLPGHFWIFFDAMAAHGVSASMGFASTGAEAVSVIDAIAKAEQNRLP